MSEQITPVTDALADALDATYTLLKNTDPGGNKAISDRDWYGLVVNQLEELVLATLSAASSVLLVQPQSRPGARINLSAYNELSRKVTDAVGYLRGEASELIQRNNFSQYKTEHTMAALGYLRGVYSLIIASIQRHARQDLGALLDQGPDALLKASRWLAAEADRVAQEAPEPVKPSWDHQND